MSPGVWGGESASVPPICSEGKKGGRRVLADYDASGSKKKLKKHLTPGKKEKGAEILLFALLRVNKKNAGTYL